MEEDGKRGRRGGRRTMSGARRRGYKEENKTGSPAKAENHIGGEKSKNERESKGVGGGKFRGPWGECPPDTTQRPKKKKKKETMEFGIKANGGGPIARGRS